MKTVKPQPQDFTDKGEKPDWALIQYFGEMLLWAVSKRHPRQTEPADDSEKCDSDSPWDTTSHNTPCVRGGCNYKMFALRNGVPQYRCSSLTLIGPDVALACLVTVAGTCSPLGQGFSEGLCFLSPLLVGWGRGAGKDGARALSPRLSLSLARNALQPAWRGTLLWGLSLSSFPFYLLSEGSHPAIPS